MLILLGKYLRLLGWKTCLVISLESKWCLPEQGVRYGGAGGLGHGRAGQPHHPGPDSRAGGRAAAGRAHAPGGRTPWCARHCLLIQPCSSWARFWHAVNAPYCCVVPDVVPSVSLCRAGILPGVCQLFVFQNVKFISYCFCF